MLDRHSREEPTKEEPKEGSTSTNNSKKLRNKTKKEKEQDTPQTSDDVKLQEDTTEQQHILMTGKVQNVGDKRVKDSDSGKGISHKKSEQQLQKELAKRKSNSVQARLRGFRLKHRHVFLKQRKERVVKNRLSRYFRGAKKEHLGKLSAERLASYGLDKKKKKH